MYEKYFGFREKPFSLSPDPSFLYLGRKHGMALTMLEYGVTNDSPIIVISGEIGSGKTTLIRHLLNTLQETATVGLISNTHKAFGELIQWVAMAFGLPFENKEKVALYSSFVDFLIREYARGKRTVLIVDEAQNMDAATLEELRVISNINADKDLVLQLVLVGQPELRATLRRPNLEQFAQRISVDYHLEALDRQETHEYIEHRLTVAGGRKGIITRGARDLIYELSTGVPRIINSLCDTALVYAFAEGKQQVATKLVQDLVAEKEANGLFGAGKIKYDIEDIRKPNETGRAG
jgi:general secretion pathway protein A